MAETIVIFETTDIVFEDADDTIGVTLPANAEPVVYMLDDDSLQVVLPAQTEPVVVLTPTGIRGPRGDLPVILGGANFVIDGGRRPILAETKGDLDIPFDCTILKAKVYADQPGSIEIDIWRSAVGAFPPVLAGSLTNGAGFGLSAAQVDDDLDISGWDVDLAQDDVLRFVVNTVDAVISRVTVALTLNRPQG